MAFQVLCPPDRIETRVPGNRSETAAGQMADESETRDEAAVFREVSYEVRRQRFPT